MRKNKYKNQLTEEEVAQLEEDYIRRLYEIINKAERELEERTAHKSI